MAYVDEATKRSEHIIATIDNDKNIPDSTKKVLSNYIGFLKANGLSDRTINKKLYSFAVFLKTIGNKDLTKVNKDDIMAAIAILERSKYSPRTKIDIKVSIKAMFKHINGNDEFYPPEVRWIKTTLKENKRTLPEDILTEDEVLKILETATDMRDKALIALLFDSGVRVGELIGLCIKDVDLTTQPAHIVVSGKTGMRRVPIMFSVPYLANYLNSRHNAAKTDYLWNVRGSWSNMKRPIDRSAIAKILLLAAQRAGISKRVNPHSWRHARATYYANRLTEQQLKMFFGWTGSSKMAATYVHLSGRDLDNGILQANGYKVQALQEPKLKAKLCPKCKYTNGIDMLYCGRCGSPLDIETAMNMQKLEKMAIKSGTDPKEMDRMVEDYIREKYLKSKQK